MKSSFFFLWLLILLVSYFAYVYPTVPAPFVERLSFPPLNGLVENQLSIDVWIYFWMLSSIPLIYILSHIICMYVYNMYIINIYYLYAGTCCFDNCSFVTSLCLLLQTCFWVNLCIVISILYFSFHFFWNTYFCVNHLYNQYPCYLK